jgi:hypothetical protein
MLGGYRSMFAVLGLVSVGLFFTEKLWRSPAAVITVLLGIVAVVVGLICFSDRLPLSAQRALTFLPLRVDPGTQQDAEHSTEWRLEIWRRVLPDVPKYFFKGKGYAVDPTDLYLANESALRGNEFDGGVAILAGDYHNGPLTVAIPFGIYGVLAFAWFISASIWAAWRNYRYGNPSLTVINRLLFVLTIARATNFVFVYGSLYADLFQFTSLAGLNICLNGGVAPKPRKQQKAGA